MNDVIDELENKAAEPGFYNDLENSQKVLQRTKTLKTKVERYRRLVSDWEDLKTLNELGLEEDEESIVSEVGDGLEKLKHAEACGCFRS